MPSSKKGVVLVLLFMLFMTIVGSALAYQFDQPYTANTLYGQPNGRQWSPVWGRFQGNVQNAGGDRVVSAVGRYVRWNSNAISWLQQHYYYNVAITTHSFRYDNGCSSFEAGGGFTNLPAPRVTRYWRQCANRPTEIRMGSENPWSLSPNSYYYGESYYFDSNSNNRQKFTADTYWGGSENWHQTFCVNAGSYEAVIC